MSLACLRVAARRTFYSQLQKWSATPLVVDATSAEVWTSAEQGRGVVEAQGPRVVAVAVVPLVSAAAVANTGRHLVTMFELQPVTSGQTRAADSRRPGKPRQGCGAK